jgi:hypothetical protein
MVGIGEGEWIEQFDAVLDGLGRCHSALFARTIEGHGDAGRQETGGDVTFAVSRSGWVG